MSESKKNIIVVTPRFPYPEAGADEQDRAESIRQLVRLGYCVHVVAKVFPWQDEHALRRAWQDTTVTISLVPYQFQGQGVITRARKWGFWLTHPWCLDGSALEYAEPYMQQALTEALVQKKPFAVWFDYTYLWPLYSLVERYSLPIFVRSINVESHHYLQEVGRGIVQKIKAIPKHLSEKKTIRAAKMIFAITPDEAKWYANSGGRVMVLPLRSLSAIIGTHTPRQTDRLHVFFMGSTYTVSHNQRALHFVIQRIAPESLKRFGMQIVFHIFGAKVPGELKLTAGKNVVFEGFVADINQALQVMDVALAPSFFGAGMQQKIFEPIARGFPTITSARGLAGYPIPTGKAVLCADSLEDYMQALDALRSFSLRSAMSEASVTVARSLFPRTSLDRVIVDALENL